MLPFKKLTILSQADFEPFKKHAQYLLQTFQGAYLWRRALNLRYCVKGDFLFLKLLFNNNANHYIFPIGDGDYQQALEWIKEDALKTSRCFSINQVLETQLEIIAPFAKENLLSRIDIRDHFEYWYETERMSKFAGKKLQAKRNHVNQFLRNYNNWTYEPIKPEDHLECIHFIQIWEDLTGKQDNASLHEDDVIFIDNIPLLDVLGLDGGILRIDGKIVAISVGCELNKDTKMILFEKALYDIKGAYPMIFQLYVNHFCQGYKYVSRLDDVGDPGLRKAKLSYYPDILQTVSRFYRCLAYED